MVNGIRMFVDDIKIWKCISKIEDQESLKDDLNKLEAWSDKWLLKFNPEKCKVLNIEHT